MAGKTQTFKRPVQSSLDRDHSTIPTAAAATAQHMSVEALLIETVPILESYGNASIAGEHPSKLTLPSPSWSCCTSSRRAASPASRCARISRDDPRRAAGRRRARVPRLPRAARGGTRRLLLLLLLRGSPPITPRTVQRAFLDKASRRGGRGRRGRHRRGGESGRGRAVALAATSAAQAATGARPRDGWRRSGRLEGCRDRRYLLSELSFARDAALDARCARRRCRPVERRMRRGDVRHASSRRWTRARARRQDARAAARDGRVRAHRRDRLRAGHGRRLRRRSRTVTFEGRAAAMPTWRRRALLGKRTCAAPRADGRSRSRPRASRSRSRNPPGCASSCATASPRPSTRSSLTPTAAVCSSPRRSPRTRPARGRAERPGGGAVRRGRGAQLAKEAPLTARPARHLRLRDLRGRTRSSSSASTSPTRSCRASSTRDDHARPGGVEARGHRDGAHGLFGHRQRAVPRAHPYFLVCLGLNAQTLDDELNGAARVMMGCCGVDGRGVAPRTSNFDGSLGNHHSTRPRIFRPAAT